MRIFRRFRADRLLGAAPLVAPAAVACFSALPGKRTDVQPVLEAV
jgi:hypothetical protein